MGGAGLNPGVKGIPGLIGPLDTDGVGRELAAVLPEVVFAVHFGSTAGGRRTVESDIDLALLLSPGGDPWGIHRRAQEAVEKVLPEFVPDIAILNGADPIFRFEVLGGRLLFCRDLEVWLEFVCSSCRAYELQMVSYERQRKYRLEVWHAHQWSHPAQAGPAR